MPVLFQINVAANWGSHGRIAEGIGEIVQAHDWDSYIAYGRYANPSKSQLLKVGSSYDTYLHGAQSLLLDRHGLASKGATWSLIRDIDFIQPDIVQLHNIHGYYLNYPLLFEYLSSLDIPVVWTLHDAWAMTGHCAFPALADCTQWQQECVNCPLTRKEYPKCYGRARTLKNFQEKKYWFNAVHNLHIVTVSKYLEGQVRQSFLKGIDTRCIYNGVDIDVFHPYNYQFSRSRHYQVLGVASVWEKRKGLKAFRQLRRLLPDNYDITLVGLTDQQERQLPYGISCVSRTDNIQKLVELYANADVFVNPSHAESFGMTTAESLACGTPAIVYDTTACPELVDEETGDVVPLDDLDALVESVRKWCENPQRDKTRRLCRERAVRLFSRQDRYQEYFDLYTSLMKK
jgi:glycosyltransferase involved in cell wall biosynthesis